MFDLAELDRADAALNAIATGAWKSAKPAPAPAPERPAGDVSRCPFHNGTLHREEARAA
jgi:hypothetical protein